MVCFVEVSFGGTVIGGLRSIGSCDCVSRLWRIADGR
jgi:hypothetical protein